MLTAPELVEAESVEVFDDPSSPALCEALVEVVDRSAEDGFVGFEVWFGQDPFEACDIHQGFTVTATAGEIVAEVVVTGVQVMGVDEAESQVYGVAEAGTAVEVHHNLTELGSGASAELAAKPGQPSEPSAPALAAAAAMAGVVAPAIGA